MTHSTLHGAKFLVEEETTLWERIFWFVCIFASWCASGMLITASLSAFQNDAISFVAETSYRDWNTNFPSVIVCEAKNMDRIQEFADEYITWFKYSTLLWIQIKSVFSRIWGDDHDFILEEVLSEIAFFRGESYHTIHECTGTEHAASCFHSNFLHYAQLVRSECEETLDNCYWNDEVFDCCKYFKKIHTELGLCYSINSLQSK